MDLEPCGKLHLKIDLRWSQDTNPNQQMPMRTRGNRDQPFLNRRRGAMRRRVHQVSRYPRDPFQIIKFPSKNSF